MSSFIYLRHLLPSSHPGYQMFSNSPSTSSVLRPFHLLCPLADRHLLVTAACSCPSSLRALLRCQPCLTPPEVPFPVPALFFLPIPHQHWAHCMDFICVFCVYHPSLDCRLHEDKDLAHSRSLINVCQINKLISISNCYFATNIIFKW